MIAIPEKKDPLFYQINKNVLSKEKSWGQTKDNKIGSCCFSAKDVVLRGESRDLLTQNQDNVYEWSEMYIYGLLV
jgi:hypothetical protein